LLAASGLLHPLPAVLGPVSRPTCALESQQYFDWFKYQFWRFVFVQQIVGKEIQTFLDYPPMQRGASFNLDAVKAEMGPSN
jgi:hypothetical protein